MRWETVLNVTAALGAAVVAGVFFAFSAFVMAALARLPGAEGAAAMREINLVVVRSALMPAMFGTALLCLVAMAFAMRSGNWWAVGGAAVYLFGVIAVTVAGNVPLNDLLAAEPTAAVWARYLREWTWWNHLRTLAGIASAAMLMVGVLKR